MENVGPTCGRYKQSHSITLFGICNAEYMFTFVKLEGLVNDAISEILKSEINFMQNK